MLLHGLWHGGGARAANSPIGGRFGFADAMDKVTRKRPNILGRCFDLDRRQACT